MDVFLYLVVGKNLQRFDELHRCTTYSILIEMLYIYTNIYAFLSLLINNKFKIRTFFARECVLFVILNKSLVLMNISILSFVNLCVCVYFTVI